MPRAVRQSSSPRILLTAPSADDLANGQSRCAGSLESHCRAPSSARTLCTMPGVKALPVSTCLHRGARRALCALRCIEIGSRQAASRLTVSRPTSSPPRKTSPTEAVFGLRRVLPAGRAPGRTTPEPLRQRTKCTCGAHLRARSAFRRGGGGHARR
jgi:hypothetical protein